MFGEVVPTHHQGWTPALIPESRTQGTEGFECGPKAMGSVGEFDEEKSPGKKGFQQTPLATERAAALWGAGAGKEAAPCLAITDVFDVFLGPPQAGR